MVRSGFILEFRAGTSASVQVHPETFGKTAVKLYRFDSCPAHISESQLACDSRPYGFGAPGTLEHIRPILVRHLEARGRTWEALVAAKRARRMQVTGWADDPVADMEDMA